MAATDALKHFFLKEEWFLNAVEQAPMSIAVFSGSSFVIEIINKTGLEIIGRHRAEILHKPVFEVMPELEPIIRPVFSNVYLTGRPYFGNEFPVQLNRYGQVVTAFFNFTCQPLIENNEVKGLLVVASEITQQVQAQKDLADAEERVRIAVASGDLGTFDLDILTGKIHCSPRFFEIFGSKDPITREEGVQRILPEDLPIRNKALATALETGSVNYEVRIRWEDGSIHWMRMDAKYFYDETGKPIRLLGTTKDVTTEKIALQKIEESEQHFRNLIQEAPLPKALLHGPDYIIEVANDAVLELWNKDKSIIGKPLREAVPEIMNEPYLKLLNDVYRTGISYRGNERVVYLPSNGELRKAYLNIIFKRLKSHRAPEFDILITGYDVTQQVYSRRKIEQSEKELQKINQRLEIALEAGKLGSYELELATGIIQCTAQHKSNYGKSASEIFNFVDVMHSVALNHKEYVQSEIEKAIKEHKDYNAEYAVVWPDNSLHWVRDSGKAVYDEDGKAIKMIGVTLDITENKLAMQRIQDSEQRLNMALEYTNTGSWDLNLQTFEIIYTPRLAEIFGYAPGAKITHPQMREHIHPDDLKSIVVKAFSKAIATGVYFYEARIIRPDETIRWIRTQGRVIYDSDKIPVRMLGTLMDITEEKNEQRRKEDFMGIIAHELKTPLTSVKAFGQFLHERAVESNDDTSAVYLHKMVVQVNKLNMLVQELLDVTRISSGKMKFNRERFDLKELIAEITDHVQITTNKAIIVEDSLWNGSIIGDRERTGQVLANLLTNAIKYSPGADKVIVSIEGKKDQIVCSVRDFGIGIAKENQKYIFDRFYRETESNVNTFPGLGLGLYISAEIIKRQGGKIWVASEKGKGSTFSFSLPINNRVL